MIHHKGGYLLSNGDHLELTELQWMAIPHMIALVSSLENGTYEEHYGKLNEREMSIEEYTSIMLNGEPKPVKKENLRQYTTVDNESAERWKRIKQSYQQR